MALITEIIKKYECQAKERIAEARQARQESSTSVWSAGPVDIGSNLSGIDTTVKEPTEQDFAYFDWQNKLVEFYKLVKNANYIVLEMQNNSKILAELDRLRTENIQLKEKLKQYEVQP